MRFSPSLLLFLPSVNLVVLSAPLREEVPFNYAWRFHLGPGGDDVGPGPGNSWQASFSQTTGACSGNYPDPHRVTTTDCATACAYKPGCAAWYQYGRSCEHADYGTTCTPATSNATATGAIRTASTALQTAYIFAAASLPEAAGWPIIDAPHDALASLNNSFSEDHGDESHGYRIRTVTWMRKGFTLPSSWADTVVFVRFEGIVHFAQLWLNGVYLGAHSAGYSELSVRLDNVSGVVFGGSNVLAVRADASYGSEHWYGGGGLTRKVVLVRTGQVNLVEGGLFAAPELPVDGSRSVVLTAEVQNQGAPSCAAGVRFDIIDAAGTVLASVTSETAPLPAGSGSTILSANVTLPASVAVWSNSAPSLYKVTATLLADGASVDAVSTSVGWRQTTWDGKTGFYLNGLPMKHRGFSHHNSFVGTGVAMPPRLDVFRVQCARAMGANFHRMSHNPYRKSLYDTLDRLGVMVWDESRDFGPSYVHQMADMVRRDRNHASVVTWSLCNEIECLNTPSVGEAMVAFAKELDPMRATTANSNRADGLGAIITVQGLSHENVSQFAAVHAAKPSQSLTSSECCSCISQRFPRVAIADSCIDKENSPLTLPFVTGSLGVWTAFDYFGEPPGPWPFVSSSFGQFDLAGAPKPNAYKYAVIWREGLNASDPGRVPLAPAPIARITDVLDQVSKTLRGIVSTPTAEMLADGVSLGQLPAAGVSLSWPISRPPTNATLLARDGSGTIVATHTVLAPSTAIPVALALFLDSPSVFSGTGSALYLDGDDIALVRIATVDSAGVLITLSPVNVSLVVVSGPGRIAGVGSGDPASHAQPNGNVITTFGGLARGLVQVTVDCVSPARDLIIAIDSDSGERTTVIPPGQACPVAPIVMRVSSAGLPDVTISIPTSSDEADSPQSAATAGFSTAAVEYMASFAG